MLQKMAYVQTLSIGFTPMVPVFAAVVAFASHTLAGNDLSVTQVGRNLSHYFRCFIIEF